VLHLVRDGAHDDGSMRHSHIAASLKRHAASVSTPTGTSERDAARHRSKRRGQPSLAPSQFENRSRRVASPLPLVHCFTAQNPGTGGNAFQHPINWTRHAQPRWTSINTRAAHTVHPLRSSSSGYPEGNFGGNQLLGGSMSLSPLCPGQTTRFARQDGGQPPPRFPKALLCPGIAHHLSGPTAHAGTQNPVR